MFRISSIMVAVATAHLSINYYRYLAAFRGELGGTTEEALMRLDSWHKVATDSLFVFQEVLGSATAIYRTWILWDKNRKLVLFLLALLLGEATTGATVCILYYSYRGTSQPEYNSPLTHWINAYTITVIILNIITTSLMAFRIGTTHLSTSKYLPSKLGSIVRTLLESAMLQSVTEILLLIFYLLKMPAMFVMLEAITSIIGITFITLTLRMKLRQFSDERDSEVQLRRISASAQPRRPTIGSTRPNPMHIETDLRYSDSETTPMTPSTIVAQDRDIEGGNQSPSRMKDYEGAYAY
ncbi:hypothetical protein V5O48_015641 [Marasmius crinis-equi]|uniref:Uncharacterized protein n=1 Tax=Marasmius crinis-equi TaxID=585013 RepID=A0ABR3EU25_9AGAR